MSQTVFNQNIMTSSQASTANSGQMQYVTLTWQKHYHLLYVSKNTLEDIHNLMLAAGTTTWDSLADSSYIGRIANLGVIPWSDILDGSYDDAQVSFSSFM